MKLEELFCHDQLLEDIRIVYTSKTQNSDHKNFLTKWATEVEVFQIQNKADVESQEDAAWLLNIDTYRQLLEVVQLSFDASEDPAKAVNLFDYGRERTSREAIRSRIGNIKKVIRGFYLIHPPKMQTHLPKQTSTFVQRNDADDVSPKSVESEMKAQLHSMDNHYIESF